VRRRRRHAASAEAVQAGVCEGVNFIILLSETEFENSVVRRCFCIIQKRTEIDFDLSCLN